MILLMMEIVRRNDANHSKRPTFELRSFQSIIRYSNGLWPLVYYLVAFIVYIFTYNAYRNKLKKRSIEMDFLKNLSEISTPTSLSASKKSFQQIKSEIQSFFYFDRIHIIFGIDLSASNEWQGRQTFNGNSLHRTQTNKIVNPYQKVIAQLGPIFENIFTSKLKYSCFGFGDINTKDFSYFPIVGSGEEFHSYEKVLEAYLEQTNDVTMSGPTAFTPLVNKLISCGLLSPRDFTMLIILTDEPKFSHDNNEFLHGILVLSKLPNTCLIIIGVGDGPWERMSYEEHALRHAVCRGMSPKAASIHPIFEAKMIYDNFHFVHYKSNVVAPIVDPTENLLVRSVLRKLPTQLKRAFYHDENNAHF